MIERLTRAGDKASADVLDTIYTEEQRHVAAGAQWFHHVCAARGMEPRQTFHVLVKRHFRGALKPPFNAQARSTAGLEPDFYEPLAG
jgi:uncharacterized ferritin-like protein (DUF455 family)